MVKDSFQKAKNILTINGGSSSIKFAAYKIEAKPILLFNGSIENIGLQTALFHFKNTITSQEEYIIVTLNNFTEAANYLINWLEQQPEFNFVTAIGHRFVHGLEHIKAQIITTTLLNDLKKIKRYDPDHLPSEIQMVEIFANRHPTLLQVACFDTAFHHTMLPVAKLLPIPRKYFNKGIHRFGFHGLSYTYLMQQLKNMEGDTVDTEKIILAHLGNGASMAAVKNGICVDTSMGFTPAGGLVMGTRSGDIDPGVAWYLMDVEKLSVQQFNHLINKESGLLGISGSTANMEELIKRKNTDPNANQAFELFCYQIKKLIGAYAAVLDGLHTLVFTAGIGEHSPEVRSQVCDGLTFLGIELDEIKNMNNEPIISTPSSKVIVRIIPTNEQIIIAEMVSVIIDE